MARAAKLDLRSFQQELATRLASKTAAQVESSRLGFDCAGEQWLIRLSDAGEVIAVPPIAAVPLTKPWFLGVTNLRGNLYSVVDLAGFLGRTGAAAQGAGGLSRMVVFGPRTGDLKTGVVVQRVLGLRNLAELAPASPPADAPAWYGRRWMDADGGAWQEIDLAKLATDPAFLQAGQ
ncbi:MAG: chemotaxis protein CheW [Betaproteobacteria bacterium]